LCRPAHRRASKAVRCHAAGRARLGRRTWKAVPIPSFVCAVASAHTAAQSKHGARAQRTSRPQVQRRRKSEIFSIELWWIHTLLLASTQETHGLKNIMRCRSSRHRCTASVAARARRARCRRSSARCAPPRPPPRRTRARTRAPRRSRARPRCSRPPHPSRVPARARRRRRACGQFNARADGRRGASSSRSARTRTSWIASILFARSTHAENMYSASRSFTFADSCSAGGHRSPFQ
jgi:hypothetical protein